MVATEGTLEPEFRIVRRSSECGELFGALAKAQGSMKGARKDVANTFFKSTYADLESVWEDCRAPLSSNGLAVVQMPAFDGGRVIVSTVLGHSSGQWIESELSMPINKGDAQGVGSAITYGRRYALAAMVGVAPKGDDDDGNAAVGHANGEQTSKAAPKKNSKVVPSDEQVSVYNKHLDHIKHAKDSDELLAAAELIAGDKKDGLLNETQAKMLRNAYSERVQGLNAMDQMNQRFAESGVK